MSNGNLISFLFLYASLAYSFRLENREMYSASSSSIARSKSPNMLNRKMLDSNSSAVNKTSAAAASVGGVGGQKQPLQQQRGRTASMPVENRKVSLPFSCPRCCTKKIKIDADADISTGGFHMIFSCFNDDYELWFEKPKQLKFVSTSTSKSHLSSFFALAVMHDLQVDVIVGCFISLNDKFKAI